MSPVQGGFMFTREPLVRHGLFAHTAALDGRCVSPADMDALNHVQSTPWRVNRAVLDVMLDVWARGLRIAGVAPALTRSLPDKVPDDEWAAMSEDDRAKRIEQRREIHDFNAEARSHECALLDQLTVADEMRERSAIWFPHSRDWRGRIYPLIASGPHPQSNDTGKALLMFSSGLPLGPDGEFWLCVRAANCAGQDKLPLADRVKWALMHEFQIRDSADDPIGMAGWWAGEDIDAPWQLLATCFELAMAWGSGYREGFVSHLPIPMDGTCNGLQHLSAMGLDPIGAKATNLTPSEQRQDIYQDIAAIVADAVEADAKDGSPTAQQWRGHVNRSTVKRAVMTTPYGVTDRGISQQLIADKMIPDGPVNRVVMAEYLKGHITAALGGTVVAAKQIMGWLQETAEALAEAGLPFQWESPTGSKYRQAYHAVSQDRVVTLMGNLTLGREIHEGELQVRKQALGAAPNFVHSYDAAHLSRTVNAAFHDGIRSFATVHDSYGTHARNTTTLARILREEFVGIYRNDWLAWTAEQIAAYAPHVELPAIPPRGTFNIEEVINAQFFFS